MTAIVQSIDDTAADLPFLSEGAWIERAAIQALHEVAGPELSARLRLDLVPLAGGLVSVAGALPASAITINRAVGFGRAEPLSQETIEAVKARYRDAGAQRFFLQVDPEADIDGAAALCEAAGLHPARGWQKFVRTPEDPIGDVHSDLTVREVGPEHGAAFARIVCDAFDLGTVAEPWLARVPGSRGWRVFMSFDGDEPAGTGALFIDGTRAWTDFGATAPAHRGRGAQGVNLAHRVRTAHEAGVSRIHSCTGEAVPGDPQHSYANILRCGFRETELLRTFAPPKTDAR